ncbi:MAG: hypothetical protein ACE5E1_03805 [Phycisphaerae bacterium]
MSRRGICGVSILAVLSVCAPARSAPPDPPLPAGLTPHVRGVNQGQVDWAGGFIIATGTGKAEGRTDRDRLMARRAGTLVAARNALAIALGLRLDDKGRFADVRNGEVHLRGVLKKHRRVSSDWRPDKTPPECIVKLKVPIWGVKGVASVVYAGQRQAALAGGRRLALSRVKQDVSGEVLVIDARGTGLEPCLFPSVTTERGGLIYDVATLSAPREPAAPVVRYVETAMTLEELRARASHSRDGRGAMAPGGPEAVLVAARPLPTNRLAFPRPALLCASAPAGPQSASSRPTSRPTTQPTTKPVRRRRRRVVRAVKASGHNKTRIVLTKEDADRLRRSPEGASLLRSGRVVVVVDSVAAGIEGRRPAEERDGALALAR